MLGKILLTLAVITTAFFYVRQRNLADSRDGDTSPKQKVPKAEIPQGEITKADDSLAADLKFGAYAFLVLMVGLAGTMYYFSWQDDHTLLTITLHRENQAQPISYQVYKFQLQDRSFITVDGTAVTVAGSERMEVLGLNQ